ncbi:MAG: thymidylate synthase [Candidatus Zambryskibacteria bacterium RIFOXYC1_FULL_39_10]|uniref:Thymidylate synthase n=1 Tax=Candidatus Zambryskibacteria bacterium RIFOXYC1_FULL_39_10 TaxID=1802779 RepID=A0A1G2V2N2_9BACT|nr:MAG: thymidylate synthase [Candidatus Zambryskibacteria bacterium RIFOXYD1_FULL_39_35]OHB15870.1 MAG: thymidylate synthase [Candidatus Zambryskibacteria bacterium RIFOXYC1_FULL_39_10]
MLKNNFDSQYISLIKSVLTDGTERITRSGAETISIHGQMIRHDMSEGFPLTTLRSIPFRLIASELQWTIEGKTDKKSLNELNNHIWDKFCNPKYVKNFKPNQETYDLMLNQNDLGPIYGFQWRHFGAKYNGCESDYSGQGFDQIKNLVDMLNKNTYSKRLLVTNWNPDDVPEMAVPSCPCMFQLIRHNEKLNLSFFQRSVDCIIGLPFDFAFYPLLLHLFCLQTGLKEGSVVGFFNNIEIFNQNIDGAKELIKREPKKLGSLETKNFKSIFDWKFQDTALFGYEPNEALKFEVNVSS